MISLSLSLSLSLCILKMSHEFALFLRHDIFVTLILSLVVMLYAIWVQTRCVLPPDSLRIQLSSIGRGLEYCFRRDFLRAYQLSVALLRKYPALYQILRLISLLLLKGDIYWKYQLVNGHFNCPAKTQNIIGMGNSADHDKNFLFSDIGQYSLPK